MRFLPDLKKLVNVEEKSASPVHNQANELDLSGLPYTPFAPVYRPPLSVSPTFLHLLFLNHQTRTATSDSLNYQHHHPGMMPLLLHCSCTLHQCLKNWLMWLLNRRR